LSDPRIKLFLSDEEYATSEKLLKDTTPLFRWDDFCKIDGSKESDPFVDENYRDVFKTLLSAIREKELLEIKYRGVDGRTTKETVPPRYLEYSSRDDRFQLLCRAISGENETAINVSAIIRAIARHDNPLQQADDMEIKTARKIKTAYIELTHERGAVERALLAFASYETDANAGLNNKINIELRYLESEEPDLLDAILSFGPLIKVLGPENLVRQIREHVERQISSR
jgi:predicted DNA-binding transcriptional regulator YafY